MGAIVYGPAQKNPFFSIPVSVIRRRAGLPAPAPGQPGPFSLGGPGVLAKTLETAGFTDIEVRALAAPLQTTSADECVRFERRSFGALHQMLAGLDETAREDAWREIASELKRFEQNGASPEPASCWWRRRPARAASGTWDRSHLDQHSTAVTSIMAESPPKNGESATAGDGPRRLS